MSEGTAPASAVASTGLIKELLLGAQAAAAAVAGVGARLDLTVDDWLILDALDSADGLSMSEISSQTIASGASLTRAVDRLVTRSLVYRAPSVSDRRRVEVRISERGRDVHEQMAAEMDALESTLRESLEDADVVRLAGSLRQIVADR